MASNSEPMTWLNERSPCVVGDSEHKQPPESPVSSGDGGPLSTPDARRTHLISKAADGPQNSRHTRHRGRQCMVQIADLMDTKLRQGRLSFTESVAECLEFIQKDRHRRRRTCSITSDPSNTSRRSTTDILEEDTGFKLNGYQKEGLIQAFHLPVCLLASVSKARSPPKSETGRSTLNGDQRGKVSSCSPTKACRSFYWPLVCPGA